MAQISPWSVKGVSPEDRETAKRAARQAGLPVGAWLSQAIRHAGQESANGPAGGLAGEPVSETASPDPGQAADILGLRAEIAALTARLDRLSESVARLQGDLTAMAENGAQPAMRNSESSAETGRLSLDIQASQAALERAVLRLSDRLRMMEEEAASARSRKSSGFLGRLFGRD